MHSFRHTSNETSHPRRGGLLIFVSVLSIVAVIAVRPARCEESPTVAAPKNRAQATSDVSYEPTVQQIVKAKCLKCHNQRNQKAELDLSSSKGILKGSESGEILDRQTPADGLLWEMVSEGLMPPDDEAPLTAEELASIKKWIFGGAKFKESAGTHPSLTQHDVLPVLYLRCTVCHGNRRREAGLDLRTKAAMLAGGKSGPAIVPGEPDQSLILKRIHAGEMPPRRKLVSVSVKPMTDAELKTLTEWIAAGAPEVSDQSPAADSAIDDEDRRFWAFQPPKKHAAPPIKDSQQTINFIDAFVLARLQAQGLTLSAPADRATLIRRASLDLTGLLPEPEEIEQFVNDTDPHAYEKLIDRLLASRHYGERWARHWLDVAGYSDSEGVQNTDKLRPHAFRYRDYVIRAFNADKPYDRFLLEQIAGDELADYESAQQITQEISDNLAATGFLRFAVDGTFSNITNFVPDRLEVVADEIDVLTSSIMGLTVKCARCHSHKFDPIPQRDYYRLAAVFKGAYDEHDWLSPERKAGAPGSTDRYLPHVPSAERDVWEKNEQRITKQVAALNQKQTATQRQLTDKHLNERLLKLPEVLRADLREMLAVPEKNRTPVQKYLAEKFEKQLRITPDELKKLDPDYQKLSDEHDKQVKALEAQRKPEPLIRALWDRGEPSPTYLLRRGDYRNPGPLVAPGVPAVLNGGTSRIDIDPPWPDAKKSGRRLAFARWLVRREHPLTARVMVNRIWRHHFGQGIVTTLGNFGKTGTPPTHPQLLDRLAVEFMDCGWSIKDMHRLMVLSATYRQQSHVTAEHQQHDADNRWLSRMPLRRMDAEVVRDTLLQIARRLDPAYLGPPGKVTSRADGLITSEHSEQGYRRSIYVLQRRRQIPTILENFDLPQMDPNCIERTESVVAPQALLLMNNALVHDLSRHFARRVHKQAGDDPQQQIEWAYRIALGRTPAEQELQAAEESLKQLTEAWNRATEKQDKNRADVPPIRALESFCHALMNSAAFVYID